MPSPPAEAAPKAEEPAAPSVAEQIQEKQEDILADQDAIARDTEDRQYKKEDSGTWIYVLVLVVLIGVVVWLVVFAANMMKKQSEPLERSGAGDSNASQARENADLRKQYTSVKAAMEEYKAAFEESQAENKRLRSDIKSLKEEIAQLKGGKRRAELLRNPKPRLCVRMRQEMQ